MLEDLPQYISIVFILTTLLTVFLFCKAVKNPRISLFVLCGWLILQAIVGYSGFYTVTDTLPPRFILLVVPAILLIVILFLTKWGRKYIDSLDLKTLTILHTVRIPVEIVLLWLFMNGKIPQLMTFEGRNYDILSGLSAPLIWYFGFVSRRISTKFILIWNFICLALLLNIVINAALSAPFVFQQFAFDQPNIGVLYFPFIWLPCCVVPLVLFSHLVAIRRLVRGERV